MAFDFKGPATAATGTAAYAVAVGTDSKSAAVVSSTEPSKAAAASTVPFAAETQRILAELMKQPDIANFKPKEEIATMIAQTKVQIGKLQAEQKLLEANRKEKRLAIAIYEGQRKAEFDYDMNQRLGRSYNPFPSHRQDDEYFWTHYHTGEHQVRAERSTKGTRISSRVRSAAKAY